PAPPRSRVPSQPLQGGDHRLQLRERHTGRVAIRGPRAIRPDELPGLRAERLAGHLGPRLDVDATLLAQSLVCDLPQVPPQAGVEVEGARDAERHLPLEPGELWPSS